MSVFTKPLMVSPLPDGKRWVLRSDFYYNVGSKDSGDRITVKKGFITDFTSVPRLLWAVYPKWGKYGNSAIIHDWLYWDQSRPRKEADSIFLEGMVVLGVGRFTRWSIYKSVSRFGFMAWNSNKKAKNKGENRIMELSGW